MSPNMATLLETTHLVKRFGGLVAVNQASLKAAGPTSARS